MWKSVRAMPAPVEGQRVGNPGQETNHCPNGPTLRPKVRAATQFLEPQPTLEAPPEQTMPSASGMCWRRAMQAGGVHTGRSLQRTQMALRALW